MPCRDTTHSHIWSPARLTVIYRCETHCGFCAEADRERFWTPEKLFEHVQQQHMRVLKCMANLVPKGVITMRDADEKYERRRCEFVKRDAEMDDHGESGNGMMTHEEYVTARSKLEDDVDSRSSGDDEYEDGDKIDVDESQVEDEEADESWVHVEDEEMDESWVQVEDEEMDDSPSP